MNVSIECTYIIPQSGAEWGQTAIFSEFCRLFGNTTFSRESVGISSGLSLSATVSNCLQLSVCLYSNPPLSANQPLLFQALAVFLSLSRGRLGAENCEFRLSAIERLASVTFPKTCV